METDQDLFGSGLKVSTKELPRLLDLAVKSLLRNGGLATADLEHLPAELFPPLFKEACSVRHREVLRAMVQAWPFPYLRPGVLMPLHRGDALQILLEGLDLLLAQKVRPRRWKLQVLDLRNTGHKFRGRWSGVGAEWRSPTRPGAVESCRMKQPLASLEVLIDLCISNSIEDEVFTDLIGWAKQREGSLHLCCKTLKISEVTIEKAMNVLALVHRDCIQELEVDCIRNLSDLGMFAPYLGQMSNLQRLSLYGGDIPDSEEDEQRLSQFISQFLRLKHLRKLYLQSPCFLMDRMDQVLRCLQTPLETLSITDCQYWESDLIFLSQGPNLSQLKNLDLSGMNCNRLSLEPLQALLEKVAPTLQDLDLSFCGLVDSHVEAILPVLSRCHQLRDFSISGNRLSEAAVENLLRHTAGLQNLNVNLLCASPSDDMDQWGHVD